MQMNNSRVLDILQQLEAVNVDTKLLKSTKIGKVVSKLKSSTKINSVSEMCSKTYCQVESYCPSGSEFHDYLQS